MKFITNFTKCILLIALIGASWSSNLLRKSKTQDILDLTLAADLQGSKPDIKKKADEQVKAARNLLTKPGTQANGLLKTAAALLKDFWQHDNIKENEKNDSNFNRSINGGILNGRTTKNQDENNTMQMGRLAKVATDAHPEPMDKAGVLAVLGDIGTAIFDCDPTKTDDKTKSYCKVATAVAMKMSLTRDALLDMGRQAKAARGGSAIAPRKKGGPNGAERANGKDAQGGTNLAPRSGLLTKNVDASGFSAMWPWQLIPKRYLEKCPEPWAGHYSGSIVEVLFCLDLFTKGNSTFGQDEMPLKSFTAGATMLESPSRKCKAALAGAFLISIGYHSAIEVKPTIWAYLGKGKVGQNPKIFSFDAPESNCDTKATDDMVKLMKDCTV